MFETNVRVQLKTDVGIIVNDVSHSSVGLNAELLDGLGRDEARRVIGINDSQ